MSRVHDMGGRYGDGAVDPSDTELFKEPWHGRALALTLAAGGLGQWNLDISRHAREQLSPKDYARFSYYEKWLAGLADLLVKRGVVTAEELAEAKSAGPSPLSERKLKAEKVATVLASGGPADRPGSEPVFSVGDEVTTRYPAGNTHVPGGHTRLPGYAAGQTGRIVECYGCHVFPDSNAHGFGEDPHPLYAVEFPAQNLWGLQSDPRDTVVLDLWEPYLDRTDG